MLQWKTRPVPVLVDPRAVVVLPKDWLPPDRRPLGISAGGVDLRLADQLVPGLLFRWVRTQLGFWLGEVSLEWRSPNGLLVLPVTQWINEHAIRPDEQRLQATRRPRTE